MSGITRRGVLIGMAGGWLAPPPARAQNPGATRVLRLGAREVALLTSANARPTPLALIDGAFPGAELRLRQGEPVTMVIENGLGEPAGLRLHGGRLPPALDGAAGFTPEPIPPGARAEVTFTPPDAGTFLLRPPPGMGALLERGLFAPVVVDPREPAPGFDRELLLVLKDIRVDPEGRLPAYASDTDLPRLGNLLTLNGLAARLDLEVRPNERLRARLVNASTARIVPLRIEGRAPVVIALDGQPSEPFDPAEGLVVLPPSGRAELALDMPSQAGADVAITAFFEGRPIPIARLSVRGQPIRDAALARPRPLAANPFPTRLDLARAQRVPLAVTVGERGQRPIAGRGANGLSGPPLFGARRGATVVLQIDNQSPEAQAIHVHGHATRPLDRMDDGWKPWLVDTILVPERQTLQVGFVADRPGRFPISLVTGASGPITWFEVS